MPLLNFGKWIMFTNGQLCLRNEQDLFNVTQYRGTVLRSETSETYLNHHKNSRKYFYTSEFKRYSNDIYCIKHLSTDSRGFTQTVTFWFTSTDKLVDVYECLDMYGFVETWIQLVEFVKECTVV